MLLMNSFVQVTDTALNLFFISTFKFYIVAQRINIAHDSVSYYSNFNKNYSRNLSKYNLKVCICSKIIFLIQKKVRFGCEMFF